MAKRGIAKDSNSSPDKYLEQIEAQKKVYLALKGMDDVAQLRILRNSAEMLGLTLALSETGQPSETHDADLPAKETSTISSDAVSSTNDGDDGINPVALRWMRRSGFSSKDLQPLFSLGIDEIDLVAKNVPGKGFRDKLRNVLLLKCVAAYLSGGVARVTDEQLREASQHYSAYDAGNYAKTLKAFAPEVSGSKTSGYTLTPRGLSAATELIQQMLGSK